VDRYFPWLGKEHNASMGTGTVLTLKSGADMIMRVTKCPEREARIQAHMRRVGRIERLLRSHPQRARCWACGRSEWAKRLRPGGWAVRAIESGKARYLEIYCPDCYAQWGWPPLGEWRLASSTTRTR